MPDTAKIGSCLNCSGRFQEVTIGDMRNLSDAALCESKSHVRRPR
jgi:hypothetical protein